MDVLNSLSNLSIGGLSNLSITGYTQMENELKTVKKKITTYDIDKYVNNHCIKARGKFYIISALMELMYNVKSAISNNTINNLFDINSYVIGYYISNNYNNGTVTQHESIKYIIENIHLLYRRHLCPECTYMTLCYLTYEYHPLNYFNIEFALYKCINLGRTANIVEALQRMYITTDNIEYINIINMLLRINSANYNIFKNDIEAGYKCYKTPLTPNDIKKIYEKCTSNLYDYGLNKTQKIELLKQKIKQYDACWTPTKKDRDNILIEEAYYIIGSRLNIPSIYEHILTKYKEYKVEIDMDKINDIIMNPVAYNKSFVLTLHRSIFKYLLMLNGLRADEILVYLDYINSDL